MKTVLHAYHFDISKPDEKQAYQELREKLAGEMGLKCFETHGGNSHWMPTLDGLIIELETKHLFNNQWNTAPIGDSKTGYRVFDWAQDSRYAFGGQNGNPFIKRGHWLEQTFEMREIRRNTVGCRYCGKQEPAAKGYVFCPHCLDSVYLKASDLKLTRMIAIDQSDAPFAELSEAEKAHLLPLYKDAQTKGSTERGKARLIKQRADIESKFTNAVNKATIEHDGFIKLLDLGLNSAVIENCIFYSHTGKFSFGWRKPLDKEIESVILEVISEFPFPYELKLADGSTKEGY